MRTVKLLVVMTLLLNRQICLCQSPAFLDSSYALVFNDEFTGSSLNANKWIRSFFWGPGYADTSVVQTPTTWPCYYPANTYANIAYRENNLNDTNLLKISGGTAKILLKRQNYTGYVWHIDTCPSANCSYYVGGSSPCNFNTNYCFYTKPVQYKYATTMLNSKQTFKYGYFEIRFRLPASPAPPAAFKGIGPNFWMYSGGPNLYWSEIDIFEINAVNNQLTDNIIYESAKLSPKFGQGTMISTFPGNTWHTAGALWTSSTVEFYFDGVKVNQLSTPGIRPDSLDAMPLIVDLNTTFTGGYGWCDTLGSNTSLPYTYEVDYVRAWQQREACDTSKTYCSSFNPANYKSKIYNYVSIGGSGCSDPVSSAPNLSLIGSNYVQVKDGFSIDNSSNVLLNVAPCISPVVNQRLTGVPPVVPVPPSFKKHYNQ